MVALLIWVNIGVTLVSAGVCLVVLLIAPLGLAAVVTCTVLVAIVTFATGLAADLAIWQRIRPQGPGATTSLGPLSAAAGLPLLGRRRLRLPQR